jgi:hypothetical protein
MSKEVIVEALLVSKVKWEVQLAAAECTYYSYALFAVCMPHCLTFYFASDINLF